MQFNVPSWIWLLVPTLGHKGIVSSDIVFGEPFLQRPTSNALQGLRF